MPKPVRRAPVAVLCLVLGLVPGLVLSLAVALVVGPWVPVAAAATGASMMRSDPVAGAWLTTAPAIVRLSFDHEVLAFGTRVEVLGPAGASVSAGPPRLLGGEVFQNLVGDLPAGDYTVRFRVTPADGRPMSGQFTFSTASGNEVTVSGATVVTAPPAGGSAPVAEPDRRLGGVWLLVVGPAIALAAVTALLGFARRRRDRP